MSRERLMCEASRFVTESRVWIDACNPTWARELVHVVSGLGRGYCCLDSDRSLSSTFNGPRSWNIMGEMEVGIPAASAN